MDAGAICADLGRKEAISAAQVEDYVRGKGVEPLDDFVGEEGNEGGGG